MEISGTAIEPKPPRVMQRTQVAEAIFVAREVLLRPDQPYQTLSLKWVRKISLHAR